MKRKLNKFFSNSNSRLKKLRNQVLKMKNCCISVVTYNKKKNLKTILKKYRKKNKTSNKIMRRKSKKFYKKNETHQPKNYN